MRRSILLLACLLLLAAGNAADAPPPPGAAERGAALLLPFKQRLKAALMEGLADGPAEAISVCRDEAPAIAAALSTGGVEMGRSSHRLRNPANDGPEWTRVVLEDYLARAGDRGPVAAALPGGRYGYAEPIVTQPLCLTCHGADLPPEVADRLASQYPADRATGFREGELRGIFWVSFPAQD